MLGRMRATGLLRSSESSIDALQVLQRLYFGVFQNCWMRYVHGDVALISMADPFTFGGTPVGVVSLYKNLVACANEVHVVGVSIIKHHRLCKVLN